MTRLKRQSSQELLPTRTPKLVQRDPAVLSSLSEGLATAIKFISANANAFCEAALEDVLCKPSRRPKPPHRSKPFRRPKPSHPPPRTLRRLTRPAPSRESKVEPQPSVTTSPPHSGSTTSPILEPETTRSTPPALLPPPQAHDSAGTQPPDPSDKLELIRVSLDLPSTIDQQDLQESELKSHRANKLPSYYQSHDHIHAKQQKAAVEKSLKKDEEEMLKATYSDKRSKGYTSSDKDFISLLKYEQHLGQVDAVCGHTLSRGSTSNLHLETSTKLKGQPHHSLSKSNPPQSVLAKDFINRLSQKAKKSLDGPPPNRPFIPSLEQIRLSRKARDEEINYS